MFLMFPGSSGEKSDLLLNVSPQWRTRWVVLQKPSPVAGTSQQFLFLQICQWSGWSCKMFRWLRWRWSQVLVLAARHRATAPQRRVCSWSGRFRNGQESVLNGADKTEVLYKFSFFTVNSSLCQMVISWLSDGYQLVISWLSAEGGGR